MLSTSGRPGCSGVVHRAPTKSSKVALPAPPSLRLANRFAESSLGTFGSVGLRRVSLVEAGFGAPPSTLLNKALLQTSAGRGHTVERRMCGLRLANRLRYPAALIQSFNSAPAHAAERRSR